MISFFTDRLTPDGAARIVLQQATNTVRVEGNYVITDIPNVQFVAVFVNAYIKPFLLMF